MTAELIPIGRLQSVASPLFLAVDAHHGAAWTGDKESINDYNSDAYRADEAVLESDSIIIRANQTFQPTFASVSVGDGAGLVMRVGSSGVLEVYRQGRRFLLVEGSYHPRTTIRQTTLSGTAITVPSAESYLRYVGSSLGPHTVAIGTIEADSGWLLLLPTVASGGKAKEAAAAAKDNAVAYQVGRMVERDLFGMLIRVVPGRYRISIEPEVDLDFGLAARAIIDPA